MNNRPHSDSPLIMVVDDNLEVLKGIQLTLEMEGYRVITAVNGQAALDKLQAGFKAQVHEPGLLKRLPDLILADIMMPLMDGYNFYERVRANPYLNHIPVVFITAKSSQEDVRRGKELGVDDYLTKPFSPEDLLAVVRGKLKRREQQQQLAAQFTGDLSKPTGAVVGLAVLGGLLLLIIIAALVWFV